MRIDGITVAELAARLGVSRQRVHQMIEEAGLKPMRVLGHRILTKQDVRAIEARPRKPLGRPVEQKA